MLDKTTALAQQLDTNVKALVSQLATANGTIASQSKTISDLQTQLQNDATSADTAAAALLQPIVDESAPPAQQ